jgi:hypothetical protein
VLAFSESGNAGILREYVGRASLSTARKVLRNARQALLPSPEVVKVYCIYLLQDWQRYLDLEVYQTQLIADAERLVPALICGSAHCTV